jgi:hypothetical protein
MLIYARFYPNEVAGLVFLESSTTKGIVFDYLSSHKQFSEGIIKSI